VCSPSTGQRNTSHVHGALLHKKCHSKREAQIWEAQVSENRIYLATPILRDASHKKVVLSKIGFRLFVRWLKCLFKPAQNGWSAASLKECIQNASRMLSNCVKRFTPHTPLGPVRPSGLYFDCLYPQHMKSSAVCHPHSQHICTLV
jgi:hypothetical protein